MNVGFNNGTSEQQATFQRVVDESAYRDLWDSINVQVEVEWTPNPGSHLHNEFAYTTNGLARTDGSSTGSRSFIALRDDIARDVADDLIAYDVIHHELGHVVVGFLLSIYPALQNTMLSVLAGKDGKTPTLDDWDVTDGVWGASALEATAEVFKDVFSARRRWDNRTVWKLVRDRLPTFCEIFHTADSNHQTRRTLDLAPLHDVDVGVIDGYAVLPITFRSWSGFSSTPSTPLPPGLPVELTWDLSWPEPDHVDNPDWFIQEQARSFVYSWIRTDGTVLATHDLGDAESGDLTLTPPADAVGLRVVLSQHIVYVSAFYPTITVPGYPYPPYPAQNGSDAPSTAPRWRVAMNRWNAGGEEHACPGWPYEDPFLFVGDGSPARVNTREAVHGAVTDSIGLRE